MAEVQASSEAVQLCAGGAPRRPVGNERGRRAACLVGESAALRLQDAGGFRRYQSPRGGACPGRAKCRPGHLPARIY